MKKKLLSVIVCLVMMTSLILTGCGDKTEKVDQKSEKAKKITLRVFTRWSDASPASQAFQDRLKEFMKQNPNITVVDESVNDGAAFDDKWKASVATNDVPDIFQNYGGGANVDYIKNGIIGDIGPDLEADSEWKNNFQDIFGNWQYEDFDGTYGVPYEFYAIALFYNKSIFQELGIEAPATIKEFEAASDKLVEAGIVPMAVGEKDKWKGAHLFACIALKKYGAELFPKIASGEVKWDGEEVIDIFTKMSEWNEKSYLGSRIVGVDYNTEKSMFLEGKTAMHYDGSWFLAEAENSKIKDEIGVVSFPYFEETAQYKDVWMGGAGGGLAISGELTGSKREAAVQLLKFLTSKEHFSYVQKVAKGGVYPVKIEVDTSVVGPVTQAYSTSINSAKTISSEIGTLVPTEISEQFKDSMQGLFGGNTAENAAKEIAKKAE